ncbi:maleate cis-trans isomerase family protein [Streptomyces beigongshangae]|uniref:maleate cis-trans isomerase family protein n=1 Tax=Streptomyces beigongshangae TaxID=2841597 RepID=UPI001C85FE9C|nr:aspartate/glutamate racemase family protein [Streptomyces sp. REN17]
MTALGFLSPGHSAEDDYPRIEQLLGSDVRLQVVRVTDEPRGTDRADRLGAGVEELRLAGAEAVVWTATDDGSTYGQEAPDQVRALALVAGVPASSMPFAFLHAVRELGVTRVAIGSTGADEVTALFASFLRGAGLEVVSVRGAGLVPGAGADAWGEAEVLALARAADHDGAEAVLLPDTSLHTASWVPALEKELGKPVLTASQVSVWEGLRLADRRVHAPELGALFTKEPPVQA